MRRKDRAGQRIYCESDGKIYAVPSWMLSPECSQLLLGPPLISAEALGELHDLLTSLPIHADCDKASQNSPPKESVDETIGKITLPAQPSFTFASPKLPADLVQGGLLGQRGVKEPCLGSGGGNHKNTRVSRVRSKLSSKKERELESFLWKLRRGKDERIDRSATSLRLPPASIKGLSPSFRNGL
jgi:hypothetical protein